MKNKCTADELLTAAKVIRQYAEDKLAFADALESEAEDMQPADADGLTLDLVDGDAKPAAKRKKNVDTTPYDAILTAWEEICPHLPQPQNPSDELKAKLKAFWHNAQKYSKWADIDPHAWVRGLFNIVSASDYLSGRKIDFRANLRWIMKPENFNKSIDGQYDNVKRTG